MDKIKSGLKERGHSVIREESISDFDKFVESADYDIPFLEHVLDICGIMRDESSEIEERRREAYKKFNSYDHSGSTARGCLDLIRRFCHDGETLAGEIEDFKYDPNGSLSERKRYEEFIRPIREREYKRAEEEKKRRTVGIYYHGNYEIPVYTTNCGMFGVDFPYMFDRDVAITVMNIIGEMYGLACTSSYWKPIFSFDSLETVSMRFHHGLGVKEWDAYMSLMKEMKWDEAEEYYNKKKIW